MKQICAQTFDAERAFYGESDLLLENCCAESEYFLMRGEDIHLSDVNFKGKYSFQYTKNVVIENSVLDTKDAFWHAHNVTVKNCIVKSEYLAWYSDGLTLEHCKIIGTQPFCYCTNLKLIDCEMVDTDLCFEKSEVFATITTSVDSIKNPLSCTIFVLSVEELIFDNPNAKGEAICRPQQDAANTIAV